MNHLSMDFGSFHELKKKEGFIIFPNSYSLYYIPSSILTLSYSYSSIFSASKSFSDTFFSDMFRLKAEFKHSRL